MFPQKQQLSLISYFPALEGCLKGGVWDLYNHNNWA
jgi:hypothetical protein